MPGDYVLAMPHHDDEVAFTFSLLPGACGLWTLVDAGYTRSMETRVELQKAVGWTPPLPMSFARMEEPLGETWGKAPPLKGGQAWWAVATLDDRTLESFRRRRGARYVVCPGLSQEYDHPHHLELERVLTEKYTRVGEFVVELDYDARLAKKKMLDTVYASERHGFDLGGLPPTFGWGVDAWVLFDTQMEG